MRGSVWVELEIWIVSRNRGRYKNSTDRVYGYSKVRDLNNTTQREINYHFAVNRAIKDYRNSHKIDSDTEVNYHLIGSGINTVTVNEGYTSNKWRNVRISTQRKRQIHKEIFLGKDKPLTKKQLASDLNIKGNDIHIKEYKGERLKQEKLQTNQYVIDTGYIHKKKKKSKR